MNSKHHSVIDRKIVADNEAATLAAYQRDDYISCYLLIHSLIESLLRAFLSKTGRERFNDLVIIAYKKYLEDQGQQNLTFIDELLEFNRRRNRVVHELWKEGYTTTNIKLEPACKSAFLMYGLFIEWLETFEPEITDFGFEYE